MPFLLDTHVLLEWHRAEKTLPDGYLRILDGASVEPLGLSDISLWEVALLYDLGRVVLDLPLREWLERATAPPLVRRFSITPEIAAEVAALPSAFHRDPADRIIVATARVHGATLLTRDERIVRSGLVETL